VFVRFIIYTTYTMSGKEIIHVMVQKKQVSCSRVGEGLTRAYWMTSPNPFLYQFSFMKSNQY